MPAKSTKTKDHGEEVSALTNDELRARLTALGINVAPIVASTRKLFEKKLINLMSKTESGFSTDENDGDAVGVKVEEPAKAVRRTRKKAVEPQAEAVESYSDDDDVPLIQNTSSRRRSVRVTKKKGKVESITKEPVLEEAAEEPIVENGGGDTVVQEKPVEVEQVVSEDVSEPVAESTLEAEPEAAEVAPAAPKFDFSCLQQLPINTIVVVLALAMFMALIWQQRDAHVTLAKNITKMLTVQYTRFYNALMPEVEELPMTSEH